MKDMSCICGLTCVVQYGDPSCVSFSPYENLFNPKEIKIFQNPSMAARLLAADAGGLEYAA